MVTCITLIKYKLNEMLNEHITHISLDEFMNYKLSKQN